MGLGKVDKDSSISGITQGQMMVYGSTDGGTTWYPMKVDTSGRLSVLSTMVPFAYDYVSFGYTGSNVTTIVFKTGGAGGTTVATLTLAYDVNDNLTSITRS